MAEPIKTHMLHSWEVIAGILAKIFGGFLCFVKKDMLISYAEAALWQQNQFTKFNESCREVSVLLVKQFEKWSL